ncbi:HNH endonuclease signature motif containing protein [Demetria terragena]|uniref:HNH endonuclease signature motif containing protein n=1 Tax=Demetria terragena TaxID=63959 RepID=UPI00035EEECA|nr:HNH endonuclease signature motif containing protein [Demetria terragena]
MVHDAHAVAADLARVLPDVAALPEHVHQLHGPELTSLVRDLLATMQLCEAAVIAAVADALTRGLINESTAGNPTQWVSRLAAGEPVGALLGQARQRSGPLTPFDEPDVDTTGTEMAVATSGEQGPRPAVPGLEPTHASRIATVATACTQPRNTVLAEALMTGRVGVPAARTALREIDKIMPVLPAGTRDEVFEHFLALDPGAGARHIRELTTRVIATYADETFLREADERLESVETVTWSHLPHGMTRLTADLTPLHAAQVRHAIDALSAPAPGNTCCDNVHHRHTSETTRTPDHRTPAKRRADALMLLITRATELIDTDPTVPTSGTTRLTITIGYDELAGTLQGFGTTHTGQALEAHTIRQIACDATILPMILGSESQPLDLGRERRLVTPGQRAAVIQRDQHCTFPGCDRPPTWCQVHHLTPWHAGGKTSLHNSALLCPRHHTIVHRNGYTATNNNTHITWNLTPSQMTKTTRDTHAA